MALGKGCFSRISQMVFEGYIDQGVEEERPSGMPSRILPVNQLGILLNPATKSYDFNIIKNALYSSEDDFFIENADRLVRLRTEWKNTAYENLRKISKQLCTGDDLSTRCESISFTEQDDFSQSSTSSEVPTSVPVTSSLECEIDNFQNVRFDEWKVIWADIQKKTTDASLRMKYFWSHPSVSTKSPRLSLIAQKV